MSFEYPFDEEMKMIAGGRISRDDATRQECTAREILNRLRDQPGLILADEVGMGKTFVGLAVAVSIALADPQKRPVTVMVPPSLVNKWPRDMETFLELCMPAKRGQIRYKTAMKAIDFLKLLDDPPERRCSVIIIPHGVMSRGLGRDTGWVKLAIIYRALKFRKYDTAFFNALCRVCGELVFLHWVEKRHPDIWERLLKTPPAEWLSILQRNGIDPEGDDDPTTDDDPVPETVINALERINLDPVYQAIQEIPMRQSANFKERINNARRAIDDHLRSVWNECISHLDVKLPLLVLDEAHHLKNPDTNLASLFKNAEALNDAEEVAKGPLAGVFERMLFLTATPFQLGHYELCSVLRRFEGISWDPITAPSCGIEGYRKTIDDLETQLDRCQESVVRLDQNWGHLSRPDLISDDGTAMPVEAWWNYAVDGKLTHPKAQELVSRFHQAESSMKDAEEHLRKWVIRHARNKTLQNGTPRRQQVPGAGIRNSELSPINSDLIDGLPVAGSALLPFLLAARATMCNPDKRPLFAEGLASSYEAFLDTRKLAQAEGLEMPVDGDDESEDDKVETISAEWYLNKLDAIIPKAGHVSSNAHPKIAATVDKALELWKRNEKCLIFCHYVETGRTLRRSISNAITQTLLEEGSRKLGVAQAGVNEELERLGTRFFDNDSPLRQALDKEILTLIRVHTSLEEHQDSLVDLVRRYIRTPSFLIRFFPLTNRQLSPDELKKVFQEPVSGSDMNLRSVIEGFFAFLVKRCNGEERRQYIKALQRVQTGSHLANAVETSFDSDEFQGDDQSMLVPNVRLANGQTRTETRQRLMLTFNTPFYPEILIASSIMAEGVDLHLNCRYIIHHDLCWNPSTLEQRTGRIDRLGGKVEKVGHPIVIYLPYIAETQDEKMYRVVMDRDRWFKVVMGEKYKIDAQTAEKIAERIPLPESVAERLAFKLHVLQPQS